jgi:23S rRNA (guanosine2251-2'-O)-methyltransferase
MALSPRPRNGARSAAFMGKQTRKVNQGKQAKRPPNGAKLPESGTRDTSLLMNDRDRRPPFRKGGGKSFEKGRKSAPRPAWRDRDSGGDEPAILYGFHTVTAALANPRRRIRKLLLTENAVRRLAVDNIDTRVPPEIVRPQVIDQRLGPDAVHQGMLAEADPLPSPDIATLKQEGIVLVLDQITDPHNVGAILRSAAAFAVKAIVTTARHSPEATGVLAKSASGALELVPLVLVQNLARALTALNERGFLTVGLDSEGSEDLSRVELREPLALVLGAEGKGLRQLTRETCATVARLDMPGEIKSLNVSNAAVLALYVGASRLGLMDK